MIWLVLLATASACICYFSPTLQIKKKSTIKISYFETWKRNFIDTAKESDPSGVTASIFLGDTSLITKDTKTQFRICGLSHLLAASGYNCFIVAFVLSILLKLTLVYPALKLSDLSSIKIKEKITLWAPITGGWLFFLWSDHSSPITRAAVMVSTSALTRHYGLHPSFFRFIILHALLFVVVSPSVAKSASFQLTFLSLIGLCSSAWFIKRQNIKNFIMKATLTSIGACLFVTPITFLKFGEINFNGVLTNLYAVPLSSALIIPLSLFSMLVLVPLGPLAFPTQKLIAEFFLNLASISSDLLIYLNMKFMLFCDWTHFGLRYYD